MRNFKKFFVSTLLVLFIVLATGCSGATKTPANLPEVRNNGSAIQWKYSSESEWHDLVALDELRGTAGENGNDGIDGKNGVNGTDGIDGVDGKDGAKGRDGTDGKDGINGKDGDTPFIGENGNWWIGTTDTGVKAAGLDGEKGDKGDTGDKGEDGEDGSCPGYFHASNRGTSALFNQPLQLFEDCNSGGLFVWDRTNGTVTLKAGHTYSISFSGSVCISHDMGGWYSVILKGRQGFLNDTLIERYMNDADNSRVWVPFAFNRIYNAGSDIVLQYEFIQLTPGTRLAGAVYNITIIALD